MTRARQILISLVFSTCCLLTTAYTEEQPPYEVPDPAISENFRNIYLTVDKLSLLVSQAAFPPFTLAEIQVRVPDRAGAGVYCTNCTVDTICVSTGIAAGQWARTSSRTTPCQ